ncbi:MAG: hypothetical protein A2024_05535 [Candidatus Edwardsbacteria bacterium GWF2_54_11]|uniref:site-specific DNA-methyltransferase (adenine-specific) n=1 Tax=Candidatus Edwardsbacteria bacterium GWF2_54_11 TaxID=1817851 RepID=A0A1F5RHX9_9BACT|nr:MAG: hypothetical protein A2502_07150 [Candidatus Edwardsbacteria bacterium RifOxyC12_full_54_24]OGF13998.1 MAG: hypothetical protein A2024_05535 [Candidatus Edwardsbacteria bacterium GWF2_54_11]OGJ17598.1 MAG: hypothetical protein A2349_04305 [Candidatus Edwardsbacteria bacterium RifOxyB12_full_52_30]
MSQLKTALQALAAQAKANNIHRMAEMQVQSSYVMEVLELLGWKDSDWKLGAAQGTNTGKFPDISLHDRNKHTVLVVECKDAKRADKLDGRYGAKTFEQQLYGYCRAEGINWGILTNFVEWRLYNDVQERLYQNKKYAFLDLLWPGANPNSYVDILSDEGLAFLMKFQRTPLCHAKGRVDNDPLYYPIEKQVEDIKAKFFVKLKGWRDSLRRELHKNYGEKFDKDQIDLFTQKILDRMIFMEVCHDKGIIGQDVHRAILSSKDDKYKELKKWFQEMDEQFNTELFAPMAIDHFDIDDQVLVPIIEELNGIDFKNVSVHIIGEVYENYLGEMLRVTKKSGLKVQEHKEQAKRKSQGIYYTPEYIVDYIVKNTVGELVKKAKTEDDLKQIKILDPACGSGSFLIKAFDVMYEAYEKLKIDRNKGQLETGKDLKIKRLILQHNLYGVDLDDRAVEITKLNLMLKALEGFNYSELKGRKLLPNLNLNIRVGNSLISGQTIEQLAEKQTAPTFPGLDDMVDIKPLLKLHNAFYKEVEDEEKARLIKEIEVEERRLNRKLGDNLKGYFSNLDEVKPLNYQVAFPEVYKQGGFDAVIGNPPYVRVDNMNEKEKRYLSTFYESAQGKYDLYYLFVEKVIKLMKDDSYFSFIIPNRFCTSTSGEHLRSFITKQKGTVRVNSVSKLNVFKDAANYPVLFSYYKNTALAGLTLQMIATGKEDELGDKQKGFVLKEKERSLIPYNIFPVNAKDEAVSLYLRIAPNCFKFSDYLQISEGLRIPAEYEQESGDEHILKQYQFNRYSGVTKGTYIDTTKRKKVIKDNAERYINSLQDKIVFAEDALNIEATFDKSKSLCQGGVYFGTLKKDINADLLFVLALANSKLLTNIYETLFAGMHMGGGYLRFRTNFLNCLPIPKIDFGNKKVRTLYDQLIKLVKEMLKLNKTPELRQRHSADIAVIDKEIDELVYRLHGLSEAEMKLVESR